MKYFFDTEFIESIKGIELISIGIVSEDGKEFYAESCNFHPEHADEWVVENVIKKLKFAVPKIGEAPGSSNLEVNTFRLTMPNAEHPSGLWELFGNDVTIAQEILKFIGDDREPEFYAYFASYDWVVFARLFGRLIDKPEHFPMWVIDLKQMMWERGLTKEWKRAACPDPEGEHNALVDAQWNKQLYDIIVALKQSPEELTTEIARLNDLIFEMECDARETDEKNHMDNG